MIGKEIDLKINFDMLPTSNKTIDAKALVLRENEKYRMMYIPKIVEKNKYRDNVYAPSQELISSIVQVKRQKDSFMKNYNAIWRESYEEGKNFKAFDPKCYLIIGNTSDLNTKQLQSFNLFRNELRTVEIITYDELLSKMEILYKALGGKDD